VTGWDVGVGALGLVLSQAETASATSSNVRESDRPIGRSGSGLGRCKRQAAGLERRPRTGRIQPNAPYGHGPAEPEDFEFGERLPKA
jgi:hypothetical protein